MRFPNSLPNGQSLLVGLPGGNIGVSSVCWQNHWENNCKLLLVPRPERGFLGWDSPPKSPYLTRFRNMLWGSMFFFSLCHIPWSVPPQQQKTWGKSPLQPWTQKSHRSTMISSPFSNLHRKNEWPLYLKNHPKLEIRKKSSEPSKIETHVHFQLRRGVSTMKKFNPQELRSCSCTDKSAAWSCWGMQRSPFWIADWWLIYHYNLQI